MTRGLPANIARELKRAPNRDRVSVVDELAPAAASMSRKFRWGRDVAHVRVVRAHVPPKKVVELGTLERIEYVATKGGDPRTTFYHDFEAPFPVLTRKGAEARALRSSRGAPVPVRDVFELGPLRRLIGTSTDGRRMKIDPPDGVYLAGDPLTKGLLIVTEGGARFTPHFIVRGASRYTITERGIVG